MQVPKSDTLPPLESEKRRLVRQMLARRAELRHDPNIFVDALEGFPVTDAEGRES